MHRKTPVLEFLCNKAAGLEPVTLFILKKRLQHKCLPVNFANFFRGPTFEGNLQAAAFRNAFSLYNTSGQLLLHFRGFNLCTEKFLEFPVKPANLLNSKEKDTP